MMIGYEFEFLSYMIWISVYVSAYVCDILGSFISMMCFFISCIFCVFTEKKLVFFVCVKLWCAYFASFTQYNSKTDLSQAY